MQPAALTTLSTSSSAGVRLKSRTDTLRAWDKSSSCRTLPASDQAVFFPDRSTSPIRINRGKQVCSTCPVRLDCLAYSLQPFEKIGTWGGHTEAERRIIRRRARADQILPMHNDDFDPDLHDRLIDWLIADGVPVVYNGRVPEIPATAAI